MLILILLGVSFGQIVQTCVEFKCGQVATKEGVCGRYFNGIYSLGFCNEINTEGAYS